MEYLMNDCYIGHQKYLLFRILIYSKEHTISPTFKYLSKVFIPQQTLSPAMVECLFCFLWFVVLFSIILQDLPIHIEIRGLFSSQASVTGTLIYKPSHMMKLTSYLCISQDFDQLITFIINKTFSSGAKMGTVLGSFLKC